MTKHFFPAIFVLPFELVIHFQRTLARNPAMKSNRANGCALRPMLSVAAILD
jgi:hypothetical protein